MGRQEELGAEWSTLAEEVLTGMKEWRLAHPEATFGETEQALDERLNRLRARMLADAAKASAAAAWEERGEEERPVCPACGEALQSRGQRPRRLQTQGGREVLIERTYGVCPACGVGVFPPG